MTENEERKPGVSVIEYILITVLVAILITVALVTLGESKEDYVNQTDQTEDVEGTE